MTTQTVYDDDIFARPPRALARQQAQPKPALNRCAVCQLPADVLLCRECAEHPEVSAILIRKWLASNLAQAMTALDRWDAIRAPQQAAWEKIQDARQQPDYAKRCAAHRAAHNVYGQLLDAQAAYEQALAPLGAERARLEKALAILEALDTDTVVATCRDCNTTFEDSNGHGLCDSCLCEYINGAGILELDDE